MVYKNVIRPILFCLNPETAHDLTIQSLKIISSVKPLRNGISSLTNFKDPILKQELFGLKFKNPFGLPAGCDKKLLAPLAWGMLGFSFAEFGSITHKAQPGNPKPRVWRAVEDKSILVYFGLNNDGAEKSKERIEKVIKEKNAVFGGSLAKTTCVDENDTFDDYLSSFKIIAESFDYITLNVSCPSVLNFTKLQNEEFLNGLLKIIQEYNLSDNGPHKPILIKISPDNTPDKLDKIAEITLRYKINGIIATNLIKENKPALKSGLVKPGGISGKPLFERSNNTIKYIYKATNGQIPIIGVGGVFTAQDAYTKIRSGASLIQVFTGFVYEGPSLIKRLCQGLAQLLERDGFKNIKEAVGRESAQ